MVWPNRKARPPECPKRMHRLILLNLESLLPAVRALLHLVTTNKSNTLHYLRLDSGVLRVVLSRLADCAKCACFLGVERRLFRLVSSWLDSPLHRVGASDPESKPLEDVMRLIKPQGGAEFVMPFYENWKATCCQIAFRCGLLPSRYPVLLLSWVFQVLLVDQQPRLLLYIFGIYRAPIEDCGLIRSALSGRLPICSAFVPEV